MEPKYFTQALNKQQIIQFNSCFLHSCDGSHETGDFGGEYKLTGVECNLKCTKIYRKYFISRNENK
jgi:hypothetical protein